jgi:hypothetical protein
MSNNDNSNYYRIVLSYEIPINVVDSQDLKIVEARNLLFDNLKNIFPERYERFSVKLTLYQLEDSMNFALTYESFFRSIGGLPMEEWTEASFYKNKIKTELEEFFNSIDCDYRQLSIKVLS